MVLSDAHHAQWKIEMLCALSSTGQWKKFGGLEDEEFGKEEGETIGSKV